MIPRAASALFPPAIRSRGDAYWTSSRVRIEEADARLIRARIRGARIYTVEIDAAPGTIGLTCNCPYAEDAGVCKHLWALFRVANHKELLESLVRTAGPDPNYVFRTTTHVVTDHQPSALQQTPAALPDWKQTIARAKAQSMLGEHGAGVSSSSVWPDNKRLVYLLDVDTSARANGVVIDLGVESLRKDGTWSDPRRYTFAQELWFASPDASDQQIAQMLVGADPMNVHGTGRTGGFVIPARAFDLTLRPIIHTGRCVTRSSDASLSGLPVLLDEGAPWQFRLRVHMQSHDSYTMNGLLVREGAEMTLHAPAFINPTGFLLVNDTIARFDSASYSPLLNELRSHGVISVNADLAELLTELHELPQTPGIDLPSASPIRISDEQPALAATIAVQPDEWRATPMYEVRCEFLYGDIRVAPDAPGNTLFDQAALVLHRRQPEVEQAALARLVALGARVDSNAYTNARTYVVTQQKLTPFAAALVRDGWQVQLDGVQLRAAGEMRATVSSGIDWFDLAGTVQYGDTDVPLARVLDAQRRGLDVIPLADGGLGLLPSAWLDRLGALAATGEIVEGRTRFRRSQLPLLDVLLATLPEVSVDDTFATARAELAQFRTIQPVDPPPGFDGVLREYQRDGLGWMHFLRRFALGGCLADDMGLGKTVQVLALLESRRIENAGPSILVVPRSLVFNWIREAERFTPQLRILDYSNSSRDLGPLDDVHLVITTYGTLRRDAAHLVEREFDYAILDEAQAIKNASTASAKACRLLRARNRLVLTGTPVENRIEELWSLLEFLNPGMLGASAKFAALSRLDSNGGSGDDAGGIDRALLSQALRPVILRRTKEKVAAELPERLEQTLEVELEPKQRKFYDSILELQRAKVLERVESVGMQRSQMHILEALLRLRQAACHPVLADKSKEHLPSAKLDALVPALAEVTAEGHKALVFSQFTEFLSLVRQRLDEANIKYEYLDGKTVDRQARVDRFQSDDDCPVFLISLRAGGQGLNLTRADYVYLLDPWWNPAVEAQAIDRAHRIGQTRRVIATRLVARDTIEEKILQLQSNKRALADAILSADQGVLAGIGREELELLLG